MPTDSQVAASKAIHRRTGKTFYAATRFLPRRVRHPTYVLYGFFRIADEVVDDADDDPPDVQRRRLEEIREAVLGPAEPDDEVLAAFREVRRTHGIPAAEIECFLDAMAQDIETARYDTHEDLEAYMRGSAVAVANMMLAVMDPEDPEVARPHASALGEAFQLTNFVRDVREDVVDRNRIYLPRETLRRHGATAAQVERLEMDDAFADAVRAELGHVESLYREGVAGINYLPEDCQFPVLLAAVLYADHHRLVRAQGYDVLTARPSLSTRRKLSLVARTGANWVWHRDPERVFHRVAPLAGPTDRHPGPGNPEPTP